MAEATHIATDEIGQRWHVTITQYVTFRGEPHVFVTVHDPGYAGIEDLYPVDALTPITTTTA